MAPLLEPIPIPDIFCSGIGAVEAIGTDCLRFYLYVDQHTPMADGPERVIVSKIVVPRSAIPPAFLRMLAINGLMCAQSDAVGQPLQ